MYSFANKTSSEGKNYWLGGGGRFKGGSVFISRVYVDGIVLM